MDARTVRAHDLAATPVRRPVCLAAEAGRNVVSDHHHTSFRCIAVATAAVRDSTCSFW
jgi:hypothetical protein